MREQTGPILTDELPHALERMDDIAARLHNRQVAVFLDYDGTLTPIVERPELAILSTEMRQALRDLASRCPVAIVSGRGLKDVRKLVGIDGLLYAGSHGFEFAGPTGHKDYPQGLDYLPALDDAEVFLRNRLQLISGCQVERKRFAIAVHFRRAAPCEVPQIEAVVDEALALHGNLRRTGGKMIFELRPALAWDKGMAIHWLLHELSLEDEKVLPLYIGDDLTDEDAFRELRQRGLTILVRDESRPTLAHYAVETPSEVQVFLRKLTALFAEKAS